MIPLGLSVESDVVGDVQTRKLWTMCKYQVTRQGHKVDEETKSIVQGWGRTTEKKGLKTYLPRVLVVQPWVGGLKWR